MDKEKLQLKHISPYLPYCLKVQYNGITNGNELKEFEKKYPNYNYFSAKEPIPDEVYGEKIGFVKNIKFRKNGKFTLYVGNKVGKAYWGGDLDGIRLILRPLSDLVKPLPSGEIPIIELAKLVDNGHNHIDSEIRKFSYGNGFIFTVFKEKCDDVHAVKFSFIGNNLASVKIDNDNVLATTVQRILEYVFANHFDVYNLIPANLAVDINSIEV